MLNTKKSIFWVRKRAKPYTFNYTSLHKEKYKDFDEEMYTMLKPYNTQATCSHLIVIKLFYDRLRGRVVSVLCFLLCCWCGECSPPLSCSLPCSQLGINADATIWNIWKFILTTVTIFHSVEEFYNVHITVASCHLPTTEKRAPAVGPKKVFSF